MAGGANRLMTFVTEQEIEETKKKRQEEWEKVRKPDDPIERPPDEYDPRPLYERLKEQKVQKQEQWEEQFKFKNMIYKGLDNEEANFLNFVAEQQAVGDAAKWHQEVEEVTAYRQAVAELQDEPPAPSHPSPTSRRVRSASCSNKTHSDATPLVGSSSKSQLSLIAKSIKIKRRKSEVEDEGSDKDAVTKKVHLSSSCENSNSPAVITGGRSEDKRAESSRTLTSSSSTTLLGLAVYSSSDSSDSDCQ